MLAQNELNEQEELNSSEVEDDDDSDHSGYTVDDSLINSFKQQLDDVQKVQQEQREAMNSLMMMPQKSEYQVEQVKQELLQAIKLAKKEN